MASHKEVESLTAAQHIIQQAIFAVESSGENTGAALNRLGRAEFRITQRINAALSGAKHRGRDSILPVNRPRAILPVRG